MNYPGIYFIENTETGRIYVGSSRDVWKRYMAHKSALRRGKHSLNELQNDYDAGVRFEVYIYKRIHTTYKKELVKQETELINSMHLQGRDLYNKNVEKVNLYPSLNVIMRAIADKYCKEKYHKSFGELFHVPNEAVREMRYKIIMHPENKKEIEEEMQPVITYVYKNNHYLGKYDDIITQKEIESKAAETPAETKTERTPIKL